MWNVAGRQIAPSVGIAAIIAASVATLRAESNPPLPAAATASAEAVAGHPLPASAQLLEVQSSNRTWQGLEFGRAANHLLLLMRDGQVRRIELERDSKIRDLGKPFETVGQRDMDAALRKEFGSKFQIVRTAHYLVCHNTNESFAREAGDLLEELYRAFTTYFGSRGTGLTRPQFPLVVLIFDDESQFRDYAANSPDMPAVSQIAGYYSAETNRVAFFNASGKEAAKYGNTRWHNLTTIVHEATHQIAFNSGCHRRFADSPLWFVEGLAMYFEAPEVQGKKLVWTDVGKLNAPRLDRFTTYRRKNRPADSLKLLVSNDDRFRSDDAVNNAYAESWALTYFLSKSRTSQYQKYLKIIAAKPSLQVDSSGQRMADFQAAFGHDLRLLDASFLRFMDEELPSRK